MLKLIDFWTSIELVHADGKSEKFPLPSGSKHPFNFHNSANFAHEVNTRNDIISKISIRLLCFKAEHVRQCLLRGDKESNLLTLDETMTIAKIMEASRKQIGVVYPQD